MVLCRIKVGRRPTRIFFSVPGSGAVVGVMYKAGLTGGDAGLNNESIMPGPGEGGNFISDVFRSAVQMML